MRNVSLLFQKGKTKQGETLLLMQTSCISEALFQIMFTFGVRALSINPGIITKILFI